MSHTERIGDTLQALSKRRRWLPILCLCLPVCAFELWSGTHWHGALVVALMSLILPIAAPVSWRLLFSQHHKGFELRLLAYVSAGLLSVGFLAGALPWLWGMKASFINDPPTVLVALLLFWVGGWTLGRDIDLEQHLHHAIAYGELKALQAEHAQLLAIRSHLDPHFLFNTLNAIAEWCHEDPDAAEKGMLQLSHMLRVLLEGIEQTTWSLEQEMTLVHSLLDLYRLRDPSRIHFQEVIGGQEAHSKDRIACLSWQLPPMVLLSLVENAIKHGPWAGHHGEIKLTISADAEALCIALSNPGPYRGPREGSQGIRLLQKRLDLLYDGQASFVLAQDKEKERTIAILTLPPTTFGR